MYYKKLTSGYIVQNTQREHAEGLEKLQEKVFPSLSKNELFTSGSYLKHLEVFPEGQFVVLDGDKVIGMSTTMRYHYSSKPHTFLNISGGKDLKTHEQDGKYLYGLDLGVDPDYRGKGIAKAIYRARQEVVRKLQLEGQMIVGMLNGYHLYTDSMSVKEYYAKVRENAILDPTVSVQMKIGFKMIKLIENYLKDPACGNAGALLVMESDMSI